MSQGSKGIGAEYLVRKSDAAKAGKALALPRDILIVEDEQLDGDRLTATLRTIYGYALEVRRSRTLSAALDEVLRSKPDVVLLDDDLITEKATDSIPILRRVPYEGPIIIVSGKVDRIRRTELIKKGANDTINKDDLDSVEIAEALARQGFGAARIEDAPKKG